MERIQAYRYELKPYCAQERNMRRFAGSRRFVYNRALGLQKARHEAGEKKLGYAALCKELTQWRNSQETPWLMDAPVHILQQSILDLDRAYENFFKGRAAFPRFRKKGTRDSFRFPHPKQFRIEQGNSRIFLPKLRWMRYRNSQQIEGELRNVTVSRSGEKWFISVQTKRDMEQPVHPSSSMVGIDLGVVRFATLSNGKVIEPLNSFKNKQKRLARYQRMMARRKKFSKNWIKAKAKVQKVNCDIANTRQDFLHKATTEISKNHAVVVVEDLKVANMSRSAAGTVDKPGSKVKQKSGLNRSILDQAWGEFRRQLGYKLDWLGGLLLAVLAANTSRTCPVCHHVSADNRRTQALFLCVQCGHTGNADDIASQNIEAAGQAVFTACGGIGAARPPDEAGTRRMEALCATT